MSTIMYIYDQDTMEVVKIIEGSQEFCEATAEIYSNEYAATYSPALGFDGGLVMGDDVDTITEE